MIRNLAAESAQGKSVPINLANDSGITVINSSCYRGVNYRVQVRAGVEGVCTGSIPRTAKGTLVTRFTYSEIGLNLILHPGL